MGGKRRRGGARGNTMRFYVTGGGLVIVFHD